MKSRLKMALLMVLGSFLVYCAQDLTNHMSGGFDMGLGTARDGHSPSDGTSWIGDGPVGEAGAQACCDNPVPQPTVILDETLMATAANGNCYSRELDLSPYRRVVAHLAANDYGCPMAIELKHGSAGFLVLRGVPCTNDGNPIVSIDPQLGRTMRLRWSASSDVCTKYVATVVGYK